MKIFDRNYILGLIPRYGLIPLAAMLCLNMLVYGGSRLFTTNLAHYDLSCFIDNSITVAPVFVLFYVGAFAQWAIGYIWTARESKDMICEVAIGEMIAKVICLICFLALPTTLQRPEIVGTDVCSRLTQLIYSLDAADNLFPSIHCLESYIVLRCAFRMKKVPSWFKWSNLVMTVGVFLSTIFLKQHVVIDILGGIVVGEFGLTCANALMMRMRRAKGYKWRFV